MEGYATLAWIRDRFRFARPSGALDLSCRRREAYYVEMGFLRGAGMDNHEVLQSATRIGAEILGLEDKLGTVESGKLVDVLVVRSNPLYDLRNLQGVHFVIADGRILRRSSSD